MSCSTPRGSEADRLDYWYDRCDELYWEAASYNKKKLSDREYCKRAARLDEEGVGEYFRALCDDWFTARPHLDLHPLLQGPATLPASALRPLGGRAALRTCTRTSRRGPVW
jgi:hypothetical protein